MQNICCIHLPFNAGAMCKWLAEGNGLTMWTGDLELMGCFKGCKRLSCGYLWVVIYHPWETRGRSKIREDWIVSGIKQVLAALFPSEVHLIALLLKWSDLTSLNVGPCGSNQPFQLIANIDWILSALCFPAPSNSLLHFWSVRKTWMCLHWHADSEWERSLSEATIAFITKYFYNAPFQSHW